MEDIICELAIQETIEDLQTRKWSDVEETAVFKEREKEARNAIDEFFKDKFQIYNKDDYFVVRQHKALR